MSTIWQSYCKIIIFGCLGLTIITTLFSVFSHVNTVNIVPDQTFTYHESTFLTKYEIKNGIMCKPEGIPFPDKQISQYCANQTGILYNISIYDSEYKCDSNTILYHTTLIHISNKVRYVYISIIIFAALFNMFAVIHDCGLIYYRNELSKVTFFPQKGDMILTKKFWSKIVKKIPCIGPLLCPVVVLVILADLVITFFTFMVNIIRCPVSYSFYISAVVTGFCRLVMIFLISCYSYFAYKFDVLLSYSDDPCYCYCEYYLNQNEMLLILLTLYSTIITTGLALPRWVGEAKYNSPYLYLITYQLPITIAKRHNESNPAFSIQLKNIHNIEPLKQSNSVQNNVDYDNGDIQSNTGTDTLNTKDKQKCPICCRVSLIGIGYFCSNVTPILLILTISITNYYGYTNTASICIGILGVIFGIISITILCCKIKKYLCYIWK